MGKTLQLSIITINRNNAAGLRKTIESVVSQTYTDFEYIIIDGASTDESVDVIKEYADRITYWVSEPDTGIYNAMNKGILKANGEYCLFLNSGDWLVDKKVVGDFCVNNFREDFISGSLLFGSSEMVWKAPDKNNLDFTLFYRATLPHPSTFIKRNLFQLYGLYNENNRIVSDWEFFLKCLIVNNCNYNHFERIISFYSLNGISSLPEMKTIIEKERDIVYQLYMPLIIKSYRKLIDESKILLQHETDYKEYINLKNGKTSWIINLLLWIKKKLKSIK